MPLVGYARVSSRDQSLAVQLEKLAGCDCVYHEKQSATSTARPELQRCLEYVRAGDVLVITRLDRLARSVTHLCAITAELERKDVALRVLDQSIDTTSPTGRLLFNVLGAIAQFETELRKERQAEGIALARSRGVRLGALRKLSNRDAINVFKGRQDGCTIASLCLAYGISENTVYSYVRRGRALATAKSISLETNSKEIV